MKKYVYNDIDKNECIRLISETNIDKPYVFEWKRFRRPRSISQNALYWLWLTAIEKETGNDKYDLHEYFKDRYLEKREVFGKEVARGTKSLDTAEFAQYLEAIDMQMAEAGILLVHPQEDGWSEFYDVNKG